jgi:hypothetical protein
LVGHLRRFGVQQVAHNKTQLVTVAEEYFLRALYADPTNARANELYGETLLARGRVKDGLRYTLEAYRYEPIWDFHVSLAAMMAANGELTLKHARLLAKKYGSSSFVAVNGLAEGHLILGETEQALEQYHLLDEENAPWFLECVSARKDPGQWPDLAKRMQKTFKQHLSGEFDENQVADPAWQMIRCGSWIGEADLVFDIMSAPELTTEQRFIGLFYSDATALRQHPRFYKLVEETGLLEYWQKWGWSDYCEPDGDSFRCD